MSVLLALRGNLETEVVTSLSQAKPPIPVARRCADLAEVLAAAQAGVGSIAIINDADMTFVHELHSCGVQIVAVGAGENGRERGIDAICSPFASDVIACVQSLIRNPISVAGENKVARPENPRHQGRLVAIWGSAGSPGRSVVARDLAAEFAVRAFEGNTRSQGRKNLRGRSGSNKKRSLRRFAPRDDGGGVVSSRDDEGGVVSSRDDGKGRTARQTLLIDADTYSPSLAQLVSLNQESSALIAAARHINMGKISVGTVADLCVDIAGFSFLAGLNVGSRWREVPSPVARELFMQAKKGWDVTIVDIASQAERRDFSYDDERDGVACELLELADDVVIVGQAGVLGVRRLLGCLDEAEKRELSRVHIALTHVRRSRRTGDDRQEIGSILSAKGYENVHWISEDRRAYEEAETRGLVLREVDKTCQAVKDIASLADAIVSGDCSESAAAVEADIVPVRAQFAPTYA